MRRPLDPVRMSEDLKRIKALPVRRHDRDYYEKLADEWSPQLLNARGLAEWHRIKALPAELQEAEFKKRPIRMKWQQAAMALDFVTAGGLVAGAPVGTGKTWLLYISFLLAERYFGSRAGLLLHPANIEPDLRASFRQLAEYWQGPSVPPRWLSYHLLSRPDSAQLLFDIAPDFIAGEEADCLRNQNSTMSKRIGAYIASRPPPATRSIWVTGTLQRHSMGNYARFAIWSLGFAAPVPIVKTELKEWCSALDRKQGRDPRKPLGQLKHLCSDVVLRRWASLTGEEQLNAVRKSLAQRRADTPGFLLFDEQSCDEPLTVRVLPPYADPVIDEAIHKFKAGEQTEDGLVIGDPLSFHRISTQLECGFYTILDPPPPPEYVARRNAWNKFVRDKIKATAHLTHPLDSEARVALRYPQASELLEWREIKPTYDEEKHSRVVPISLSTCAWAARWLELNSPALVWTQHTWVGETIARMAGIDYYGPEGRTSDGRHIAHLQGGRSAVLSAHSNRRGRNLQDRWCRNLVVAPESSAERWEQMIGRTHRQGQLHPVSFDILLTGIAAVSAIESAISEAEGALEDTFMPQKLLIASWDWSRIPGDLVKPSLDSPSRSRWTRRST